MIRYPDELPKAVAAVEFLRHRLAAAHHLALVGIYRSWPKVSSLDASPELLAYPPAAVAPELQPHYWRALGFWAGWHWFDTERSLSALNAHLHVFVPRLDLSVQRAFLQGIGELLFFHLSNSPWFAPVELERFPQAYHQGLLEGWGMAQGEEELYFPFPWKGPESPFWTSWTKGLSARSVASIQRGKAQFDALFEGPAPGALEPSHQAP